MANFYLLSIFELCFLFWFRVFSTVYCCVWRTQQLWLTHIAHAATVFEHPVTLIQMSALAFANDLHINDNSILPSLIIAPIIFGIHLLLFFAISTGHDKRAAHSQENVKWMEKPIWIHAKTGLKSVNFSQFERLVTKNEFSSKMRCIRPNMQSKASFERLCLNWWFLDCRFVCIYFEINVIMVLRGSIFG